MSETETQTKLHTRLEKIVRRKRPTPYQVMALALSSIGLALSLIGLGSLIIIASQARAANEQARLANEQAREARKQNDLLASQAQLQNLQALTNQLLILDKLFIEHPEMRQYFYDNVEISGDKDKVNYQRALAIAEFQIDFFDTFLTQESSLNLADDEREAWHTYIIRSFARSRVMCVRLNTDPDWYGSNLKELAHCH